MTIQRLRPAWSADQLVELYPEPHDHTFWLDHVARVDDTVNFARQHISMPFRQTVADLSCGDATIGRQVVGGGILHLGDFAGLPAPMLNDEHGYQGPIEQTIEMLPLVQLFVCSEMLEHVDSPNIVLGKIRKVADRLLLTTPVGAWNDPNEEHYWAWDREGVEHLLTAEGWHVEAYDESDGRKYGGPYVFGMWLAS